jgi:protein-S-isoprenylcysteine O-methyltransferase Ste14
VFLTPALRFGLWNTWLFMAVFLLQMLAVRLAGEGAWQRSHLPNDIPRRRSDRWAAALANGAWLLALSYSLFLPMRPGTFLFAVGLLVFAVGAALLAWATWDFTRTPADQPIVCGAYVISRHPLYLATFLICLGAAFAGASWPLVLLSVVVVLCFRREALLEEKYCLERYGDAYRDYRDRTCRWFGLPHRKIP